MAQNIQNDRNRIDKISITNDCLTGRAGLALVSRFIRSINIAGTFYSMGTISFSAISIPTRKTKDSQIVLN